MSERDRETFKAVEPPVYYVGSFSICSEIVMQNVPTILLIRLFVQGSTIGNYRRNQKGR